MTVNKTMVHPFDSFVAVCKLLVWAGYYEPLEKGGRLKHISHRIYRILVILYVIVYNLQHLIFIVQNRNDVDLLMDAFIIEIPQINLFAKSFNMLINISKIHKLESIIKGPHFSATEEQDVEFLKTNKLEMDRVNRFIVISVIVTGVIRPIAYFFNRYYDPTSQDINSYMPFETDTLKGYSLAILAETFFLFWTGHGHLGLDHLVGAYYAHAQTQVKIIKNQLQRLSYRYIDEESIQGVTFKRDIKTNIQYIDQEDESIYERFIQIVKRYETLVLYKNEVDSVFNFPLSVQFLSTASVVCLIIFKMTTLKVTSLPFTFFALLCILLLLQVFMYCYYGNHVEFESRGVVDSAYECDWVSLSPRFRRALLLAMCRWSQPLKPKVAGIIPLSLNTFSQIVKTSYSLYTVLVVAAKPEKA